MPFFALQASVLIVLWTLFLKLNDFFQVCVNLANAFINFNDFHKISVY